MSQTTIANLEERQEFLVSWVLKLMAHCWEHCGTSMPGQFIEEYEALRENQKGKEDHQ